MRSDYSAIAKEAVKDRFAMQKPSELASMLGFLAGRDIKTVLEIGGMHGGTLWAWRQVSYGKLVCVDLQVLEGRMEYADTEFELIVGDSTLPETRDRVSRLMGDERFDFVFIDGDHRYEAVMADAANWLPLVMPGGVIAFHDICHRYIDQVDSYHDMWRFWSWMRQLYRSFEIYDPTPGDDDWGGIGVVLVPPVAYNAIRLTPFTWLNLARPAQTLPPVCEKCQRVLLQDEEILCVECAA